MVLASTMQYDFQRMHRACTISQSVGIPSLTQRKTLAAWYIAGLGGTPNGEILHSCGTYYAIAG